MRYTTPMNTRGRLARALVALIAAGFVLMAASSAFALDRYGSREGLFVGFAGGGGIGGVDLSEGQGQAGFEDGRLPGIYLSGIVGGGVNDNIVLGAQLNWWGRSVEKKMENNTHQWAHNHSSLLALGDFFLFEGLYVEGGGGLAYSVFEGVRGDETMTHQEMGFALKGGVGFEYFINGTHALGLNGGYTRHFYDTASFDTFNVAASIRWY